MKALTISIGKFHIVLVAGKAGSITLTKEDK